MSSNDLLRAIFAIEAVQAHIHEIRITITITITIKKIRIRITVTVTITIKKWKYKVIVSAGRQGFLRTPALPVVLESEFFSKFCYPF